MIKGSFYYEHMMPVETFVSRGREMEMSVIAYSVYLALCYLVTMVLSDIQFIHVMILFLVYMLKNHWTFQTYV